MPLIQQAIFSTHAGDVDWKTDLLVATGPICATDLKEMAHWLTELKPQTGHLPVGPVRLLFHPLPSGRYALGRWMPYYQHGHNHYQGHPFQNIVRRQVVARPECVQFLIMPPEALALFGNNPIVLLESLQVLNMLPRMLHGTFGRMASLSPIYLPRFNDTIPLVNAELLHNLAADFGIDALVRLLQLATDSVCTVFSSDPAAFRVINGLYNLLPFSCRLELTFSTNIPLSSSLPFRVSGMNETCPRDVAFCKSLEVPYIAFPAQPMPSGKRFGPVGSEWAPFENRRLNWLDRWSHLIACVLRSQTYDFLEARFAEERRQTLDLTADARLDCLQQLGLEWMHRFHQTVERRQKGAEEFAQKTTDAAVCVRLPWVR